MILLDTNVLSELLRPRPHGPVVAWLATLPAASVHVSSVTQAEMLYGVATLSAGRRRVQLEAALQAMFDEEFDGRVLPFDAAAAPHYAAIAAHRRRRGRPISQFDAQIAAIARAHGATLATRNVADFELCGIALLDPWQAG